MERLTKITKLKGDTHYPYYTLASPYDDERDNYWAIQKLAAYENTGLEPGEIAELQSDFAKCKRMYDDLDGLLATVADERDKLKHCVAVLEKALELTAAYLFDYYGTADFDVCDSLEEYTEPDECDNCPRDIESFTKCYCRYFVNRAEEV